MAVSFAVVMAVLAALVISFGSWKVLNWVWVRPRKLEKQLRLQGFKGNSYRLLYGDTKELVKMTIDAKSKPIGFSDDILPRVYPFFHKLATIHGRNIFTWLGPNPMVNIMDPELIKEIFSKHDQFQKPKSINPLAKLLVSGLIGKDGDKWVQHRKIINPAFHMEKLKHIIPAFSVSCTKMVEKWEEIVSKTEEGSCELNVWPYLQTLSEDAISRAAFGSSHEEGARIFVLQKEQCELAAEALRSIYIPGSRFLPSKRNRRMKEIAKDMGDSIRTIISKRLEAMKAGESTHDLLGMLLESNQIQQRNKNSGMSIEEIIEECKFFYLAGQETTSDLLVWTMILLSHHQHWQEQAREEVFQVFGNKKPDQNGLNNLKVLSMIFNEVMRLYPPAIVLRRMTNEEMKVGDIALPAGVVIQVPVLMLHRDRELWGDDVNEFKPDRFSGGVSKVTNGKTFYLPFGAGPRICVGQNFALLEAKMAVAMVLQRFSFALSASYSHAPHSIMTLQPQNGAHLVLHKL